jgi:hypothetical protein
MSFLQNAFKKLDHVRLPGRRDSAPPDINPPTPLPPQHHPLHKLRSRNNTISLPCEDMRLCQLIADDRDTIKVNPFKYLFLVKTDPCAEWERTEKDEQFDYGELSRSAIEHKVFRNRTTNELASTRIFKKFSDDLFDDYLFEIGILTEHYPKFPDHMSEIETLRECRSHKNIVHFYEAYFFESKLWVSFL